MKSVSPPTSSFATVTVTGWLRVLRAIAAVSIVAGAGEAAAQPAEPPPEATPPPPGQVELEAIAAATARLEAQGKTIDSLGASLAESLRAQEMLREEIAAERGARIAMEARSSGAPPAVQSAWSHVTLSGLIQVDTALRQSSADQLRQSGEPLNQDRVLLRRGRPRISASYGDVSGLLEIDVNTVAGGQVRPSFAEVAYQVQPWLRAALGIVKIPFGFEVDQTDGSRLFMERSTVIRALFPGEYDVGAKISGEWRFVRYAIAAQNGEPVGEKGFSLRDPNRAKDISARVGVQTTVGDVRAAGGFSMLSGRGFHAGTPATKDTLIWKDLNEDGVVQGGEIQVLQGQAATPSDSFDRFGLGLDAEVAIDLHSSGTLLLYGELIAAGNLDRAIVLPDPISTGRDLRELGYYAAAVYSPNDWSSLGVRYDHYDPDADAAELRTGDVVPVDATLSTLSFAAALQREHGRLILQYDHNKNHSGRTTAGVPTNLGDDAVTLRAEVQL